MADHDAVRRRELPGAGARQVVHLRHAGRCCGLLAGRELVSGAAEAARRTAEYLTREMVDGGAGGFPQRYSGKYWIETAQIYVLAPLVEAAEVFDEPEYRAAALRCLEFYTRHADFLRIESLTHFLAYELEALLEMGRAELAEPVLRRLADAQRADGAVRGAGGVRWVCVPGLAQLRICWYRLGWHEPADRAMAWLDAHQSADGGFRGSIGLWADYKRRVRVSWGPKFYLDAHRERVRAWFGRRAEQFPGEIGADAEQLEAILARVNGGEVLEVGCGKGRFIKAIAAARPDVVCTAVEPAAAMAAHLPPGITCVWGVIESIPLEDGRFDTVYAVEALQHSANPERAVAEMIRVAKPGGWVVVIDKERSHYGRLECPAWEHWPEREWLCERLRRGCDEVSARAVTYEGRPADGLMYVWEGRKRGA